MTWVNFRELRQKLDVREVLDHYRIAINARNGVQHHGPCPLPSHQGPRRSASFSVNLDKGIFRCFGCGAQGNIIDLVAILEKLDPARPEDIRRAALLLADRYRIVSPKPTAPAKPPKKPEASPQASVGRPMVNAPLDFALKGLDPEHPYLKEQGFTPETIEHFELGYAARGLMQGRIAVPLRDTEGQLIGYAGRVVDDSLVTEENPSYRFPTAREHDGKRFEFDKSLFLYHAHAVLAPAKDLILVSSFRSCWWLWQHGFPHTISVMGSGCSSQQSAIIVGMVPRDGRVWVFTDGTKVGRYLAEEILRLVTPYRFCRWVELRNNRKPSDCTLAELRELLA
jgi:DNA primase